MKHLKFALVLTTALWLTWELGRIFHLPLVVFPLQETLEYMKEMLR